MDIHERIRYIFLVPGKSESKLSDEEMTETFTQEVFQLFGEKSAQHSEISRRSGWYLVKIVRFPTDDPYDAVVRSGSRSYRKAEVVSMIERLQKTPTKVESHESG